MKPALHTTQKLKVSLFVLFVITAASISVNDVFAAAGGIQICSPSSTCEVGEFLYNDDYTPYTGATCTITVKNPDDSTYVSSASMTGQSDGWYSYDVTTPSTEGLYRTEVCCITGSDTICIDKTFEVKDQASSSVTVDNDAVAEAVWSYSDRTLSSFGTLVRDIWLNSTRSLTSLAIDNSSSSSTQTTNTVGSTDLSGLEKTVNENRLLLEELVNKPIIETFVEDDGELDLGVKLDETRTLANSLYANTQYIRSKSGLIISKWNSFSDLELKSHISDIVNVAGEIGDSKNNNTILGASNWLADAWGWDSANTINREVESLSKSLDSIQVEIETRGRSTNSYTNLKNLSKNLDVIENQIGDSTVSSPDLTLFGKLREVTLIAQSLDQKNSKLGDLLAEWDLHSESDIRSELNEISQSVLTLNRVAQLRGFLAPLDSSTSGKSLKNSAFAIGGVIDTNRKVLASRTDHAIAATWLELGSIVFKSVIINPSSLISQNAVLKYYLPPEVKQEDVKRVDDGLTVTYDVERDQYYVEGQFELDPNETITVSMSVEDIWIITDEELDSLSKQVEELVKPLEGTSYFAQGVTIKSDIEATLTKIKSLQSRAVTPEQKIRAYREASIELNRVKELLARLQGLVTDVSAQSSLFAFVGGAQTFGVWGIIIAILAAVVFLTVYMRKLHTDSEKQTKKGKKHKEDSGKHDTPTTFSPPFVFGQMNWRSIAQSALGLVVFGSIVSATTAFAVIKTTGADTSNQKLLAEESVETQSSSDKVLSAESDLPAQAGVPVDTGFMDKNTTDEAVSLLAQASIGGEDIVRIEVPDGSRLNVRSDASIKSDIISTLSLSTDATKIDQKNEFILVAIREDGEEGNTIEGWIHEDFVVVSGTSHNAGINADLPAQAGIVENLNKPESSQTISSKLEVEILETSTGWLRVRTAPRGDELTKVNVGDLFPMIDETTSWYKIQLPDGNTGWISKQYSEIK